MQSINVSMFVALTVINPHVIHDVNVICVSNMRCKILDCMIDS